MFVLGSFSVLEDNKINVELNLNYVMFNDVIVPDDFFDFRKNMIQTKLSGVGMDCITQNTSLEELKRNFSKLNQIIKHEQCIQDSQY